MSKSVYVVNVHSEVKLTLDVTEHNGVHLQLSGGEYGAVLEPGDSLELVLRPAQTAEAKSDPSGKKETEPDEEKETWNENKEDIRANDIGNAWGGVADLAEPAGGREDAFDAREDALDGEDKNERERH